MDIKEEIKSEELTIVKLGADWCGPCRLVAPILEKHSTNNRIFDINVDKDKDLAVEYQVRSIPTLLFFKNGELVNKHVGGFTEDSLLQMIEKNK
jgi:thioredoxin 1